MSKQFAQGLRAHLGMATWILMSSIVQAHVTLDSPNGEQTFEGGSELAIEWHVHIMHNTLDWDLWYSRESEKGPWEVIAADLAKGDISEGAAHSFDWTLPNIELPNAWIRVRQDNAGEDYYDVSDVSFRIEALLEGGDFTGNGTVDGADLDVWEKNLGRTSATFSEGDADLDEDIDGADFLTWQSDYNKIGLAASETTISAESVPEPAASVMLLLGMIFLLLRK